MVTEANLILGDEHTMQHIDDILLNCTCKTYILSTNVTQQIQFFKKSTYIIEESK